MQADVFGWNATSKFGVAMIALFHRKSVGSLVLGIIGSLSAAIAADLPTSIPRYAIVERIPGPGTNWDYLAVDAAARRLYIAHDGVTALDLDTNKLTVHLVAG
jgi:hypothetical protein